MPEAKRYYVKLPRKLGPYEGLDEAFKQGKAERDRMTIEWARTFIGRLLREPELVKKVVALLALTNLHRNYGLGNVLEVFTGISQPKLMVSVHQGEGTGIAYDNGPDKQKILQAILALDLDKE